MHTQPTPSWRRIWESRLCIRHEYCMWMWSASRVSHMGGQGDVLQVSDWGGGLVEASQWMSVNLSLDWWSTQENHTSRVPTQRITLCWPHVMSLFLSEGEDMFHLPLPQVLEHWLITGLQTYTGACLERGDTPDFSTCFSWRRKTMFRHFFSKKRETFVLFYFTSPFDCHPMGHTSTTQGTESVGLICKEQTRWSTSTSWPSSGRTHDTPRLASPGPHTAEHSPGSDARHLETHMNGFLCFWIFDPWK